MIEYAPVTDLFDYAAFAFEVFGAAYVIYGGIKAAARLVLKELRVLQISYGEIRLFLAQKLIFGLEFFIAADVLLTLIAPTEEELLILGAIVVIRVVLGHFLTKEAREPMD